MLGSLLEETLRRQLSEQFLETLALVRRTSASDLESSMQFLEGLDLTTTSQLVRAFSMYFHLANVTEQTHRGRQSRDARDADEGPLARVTTLIEKALAEGRIEHAQVNEAVRKS